MNMEIEAVFFDLGGTLRIEHPDKEFSYKAKCKIVELLGIDADPDEYCKFLDYRYAGYRKWAFETMREAPEAELWTKWMTPEFPKEEIAAKAIELTSQYRLLEGRRELVDGGREVIEGLDKRGYTLGIISNLTSSVEIPRWLEQDKLTHYFKTVMLSPVCGLRKPGPEIYLEAARQAGIAPEKCAYVGDNPDRDAVGAIRAGYGMAIIFISPEKLAKKKITDENRPDAIVHNFIELLDIFPECKKVNAGAIRSVKNT